MTERMRQQAEDALHVLRVLAARGYGVQIQCNNAVHTVAVLDVRGWTVWFDAGTLDDCLKQIDLDQYPARAA